MSELSIKQKALDSLQAQLGTIQKSNGYSRSVAKVWTSQPNGVNVPTPSVIITQGNEFVTEFVGRVIQRDLDLNITFVDSYAGNSPDDDAAQFLADIQKCIGEILTFSVSAEAYGSGTTQTENVTLQEEGSALNFAESLRGKVYGTVTYTMTYRTSSRDPRRLP